MNIKIKITQSKNSTYLNIPIGTTIEMDIETYLLGVVAQEIGNPHIEAAKAQAIAARTYAMPFTKVGEFITDDSSKNQAYNAEKTKDSRYVNAHEGVRLTAGMVLCWNGAVVNSCQYTSSNGGHVEDGKKAWMVPKDDPYDLEASGGVKSGHGRGMSQKAAVLMANKYNKTYLEILDFYFTGTQVKDNYGNGKIIGGEQINMANEKTNIGMVENSKQFLGQPYWYKGSVPA